MFKKLTGLTITKIEMDASNRMMTPIRIGLNNDRWFIRTDLWWIGYRITKE